MKATGRRSATGLPGLLAVSLCASFAAGEPGGGFGAESARQMVAELGPQEAARQVSSDTQMLEAAAAGVAGAGREWMDVGVQLLAGADAYAYLKDRLVQSFSVALEHDAAAVLARAPSGLPVAAVCAYDPFFGAETPPTRSAFDRAVAGREQLVSAVKRADLGEARDSCLAGVQQLRAAGEAKYRP